MKHFACADLNEQHPDDSIEYTFTELSAVEIAEEKIDKIDKLKEKLEKAKENAKIPKWLKITYLACVAFILIFISVVSLRDKSIPFEQFLTQSPIFIIFCFIFCALGLVSIKATKIKQRAVYDDRMLDEKVELAKRELAKAYEEAGISPRAIDVDLLIFDYTEENGKTVIRNTDDGDTPYMTNEVKMYEKNGRFCIFYDPHVCSFEKSELKAIKKIDEKITVSLFLFDWESERRARLKQKNIEPNDDADFDGYFYLLVEQNGEEYAVYFPSYELDTIEKLTGMKAE